jgi:serine/threonine-protein kinase
MPPSNSDPRLAGRFEPGTVLGGRYRIVGLLGKGGMGEVYRADDLTLGQPVALKFLPETLVGDSDWLVRFRGEVRAARQVSHPNVCRVYDIAEVDGFTFLSMEFVQGEDLAGLLRRIGRLSPDKAAEMARGLAAGLAAAHDKGVLHRDLKPGNVLIDEHGRVRLADFGLAGVEHESEGLSGTPAYMAPELFDRKPATVQSDIYALGLVLYEMFSGKQAFSGTTVGELARLHHEITPPPLTQLVPGIDPMADRIILRCLAKDPAQRPASALQVAAALPGGDPLAAALAAGETPSPEMVAASGGVGALAPRVAVACLAVALIGVSAVVALSSRTQAVQYLKYEKPSAVLADAARTILQGLGYHDPVQDQAWGYATTDYLRYLETTDDTPRRYENLRPGQPPAVTFWYRQAPVEMFSDSFLLGGRLQLRVPPITSPGMVAMMLDLKGRLHYLDAVPPRIRDTEETRSKFDWNVALRFAGFDPATLTAVDPSWVPPGFADARAAWDGVYPDRPDIKVHVEAAAAYGRLVSFQIFEPWSPQTLAPPTGASGVSPMVIAGILGLLLVVSGAVVLVRRNVRLSRGDREGAVHVASTLAILIMVAGLLTAHQSFGLNGTLATLLVLFARATLVGLAAYTFYMALEPDVRRRSPETLVSWSRAIDGRLRDPLVGRDLLIGIAVGVVLQLLTQGAHLAPGWFGHGPSLSTPLAGYDGTVGFVLAILITRIVSSVLIATSLALVYLMLYLLIRRRRFTTAAFVVVLLGIAAMVQGLSVSLVFSALAIGLTVFTLLRLGLLTLVIAFTVTGWLDQIPMTFDFSSLFAPSSYTVFAVIVAATLFGFRTSLGGKGILGARLLE